jgi:tetratricopeptide (TPR) repeat protein
MKPPIVIVLVLAALGIGAGGAWMLLKSESNSQTSSAAEGELVNEFLRQAMFGDDPLEIRTDDTRSAARLIDAVRHIDRDFKDNPALAAAVRNTLGRALLGVGRLPEGQRLLQQSVDAHRAMLPVPQEALAGNLMDLASAYYWQGQFDQAAAAVREAVEIDKAVFGDRSDALAADLSFLAAIFSGRGQPAEAEQVLRQVLEMRRTMYGATHRDVALALKNLAVSLLAQQKLTDAIETQREALKVVKSLPTFDPMDVAGAQVNLAQALLATEEGPTRVEAIELLRDTLNRKLTALGPDHVSVGITQQQLGEALRDNGDIGDSEVALVEALRIFKSRNAPPSFTANAALGLGRSLMLRAADDVAEPYLREALEIRSLSDRARIPEAALWLGKNLFYQKKYDEAEPMLEAAYNFGLQTPGPDNAAIARDAGETIIKMYEEQGKPDKMMEWHAKMANPAGSATQPASTATAPASTP